MDFNWIWQTLLIFIIGTFFLRIGGRKSISQMTVSQAIIMISIGTLLIQPVTGKGLWTTFCVASILVLSLVFSEYMQIKSDKLESVISGKSVAVIRNGELIEPNLRKLRLTVDKLEQRLRQMGIQSIDDVHTATIEVSGLLGYTLKPEKQPATKEDIQVLMRLIQNRDLPSINGDLYSEDKPEDIFTEVLDKESSSQQDDLQ